MKTKKTPHLRVKEPLHGRKKFSHASDGRVLYKSEVCFPVHHHHFRRLVTPVPLRPPGGGALLVRAGPYVATAAAAVRLLEAAGPDVGEDDAVGVVLEAIVVCIISQSCSDFYRLVHLVAEHC